MSHLRDILKRFEYFENPNQKLLPWTIQVTWTERDDDGKRFRARSVIQVMAKNITEAYEEGERIRELKPDAVLGAVIPGHHGAKFLP